MVAVSFLLPAPFLLYNYILFSSDPFLRAWTIQNIIRSPESNPVLVSIWADITLCNLRCNPDIAV